MGGLNSHWLSQLAPAHAPPPPGWWPLAPGWWMLLILLVMMSAAIIYWQRRPVARLRRIALRELKQMEAMLHDDSALAQELEHLLRRFAVARFGRDTVAGLSGERWISFLVAHGASEWAGDTGTCLLRAAYGGTADTYRTRWLSGARAFIKYKS